MDTTEGFTSATTLDTDGRKDPAAFGRDIVDVAVADGVALGVAVGSTAVEHARAVRGRITTEITSHEICFPCNGVLWKDFLSSRKITNTVEMAHKGLP
jgi:hypothetical protein